MSQLIIAVLASISIYYAYKLFRRETSRVEEEFRKAERRMRKRGTHKGSEAINLELDPSTGIYLPARD